ncbi:VWA domain-containing protein [Planktotalea sp.]|uniref:vWA domain-containing protein n=1 Tax=Planktotalea sp. TaxID=2029877 RepID=UPI0025F69C5B|nr:VWA domain-containing protein [Planktotalea sp.]
MSDDLDDLKHAFTRATPAPDAKRRAENLVLAQENFAMRQGTPSAVRPIHDAPKMGGFVKGIRAMFNALSSKAGLTATTALAAFGLVLITPVLREGPPVVFAPEPAVMMEAPVIVVEEAIAMDTVDDSAAVGMAISAPAPRMMSKQASRTRIAPVAGLVADAPMIVPEKDTEAFAPENTLKVTSETPVSTFSVDVDTASYSIVRSSLMNGQLPPAAAVRIEEMVNYFPYGYAAPEQGAFATSLAMMQTPWNENTQLLRIAVQGEMPEVAARPALNLVFLIDTSGSMNQPDKLPLLKQSLRLMLGQLRAEDQVAIVAYAGSAGQVLEPTAASEREVILGALDRLSAGGGTNGQAGLQQAYTLAAAMQDDGEISRVLLATDGDFNVGLSNPDALKDYIADRRDSGTFLSVLGFGRGNLDDATMQALAQNGNGQASYIDSLPEAQKVLVDQLTGALFPIASDVKIQVEFNPATVSEYRLIGYETRALRREDFNNDKVDAGDIGAGHQVTALYEFTPTGAQGQVDALRYGEGVVGGSEGELGYLKLRYKNPGGADSQLVERAIPTALEADTELAFAAAIAGFGELLRSSERLSDWSYNDAVKLATDARGEDRFGYRAEAIKLMRLAGSLSQ